MRDLRVIIKNHMVICNEGSPTQFIDTKPEIVEAAMKEAMEEYAKELIMFYETNDAVHNYNRKNRSRFSPRMEGNPELLKRPQEIIDLFNAHLSAIEAEKERGKG